MHRVYSGDNSVPYMRTGDDLTIRVEFEALYPTEDVVFSLEIRDDDGNLVMRTDTSIIGVPIDAPRGTSVMHFGIVQMPLLDGSFSFALGIQSRSGILYDWQENAGTFEVMNPGKTTGSLPHGRARGAHLDARATSTRPRPRWRSPSERDSHHERHAEATLPDGSPGLRGAGHGGDRRGGPAAPGLGRPAAQARARARRALPGPLARWPAAAATWARRCAWSTPPPSSTRWCPVESERAAGAVVKKGMRSLLLWYVGWVTHQMSQSASAVSRALHIVDDRLKELERQVEVQRVPAAGVVEFPGLRTARRLVGRARRGRRGQGARAASCTPPAATAGWCAASWRPAATPTASTRAPALVDAAELGSARPARRAAWPSTCAPWPRPAWAPSC